MKSKLKAPGTNRSKVNMIISCCQVLLSNSRVDKFSGRGCIRRYCELRVRVYLSDLWSLNCIMIMHQTNITCQMPVSVWANSVRVDSSTAQVFDGRHAPELPGRGRSDGPWAGYGCLAKAGGGYRVQTRGDASRRKATRSEESSRMRRLGMRLCPLNINYKQRYVAISKVSHFPHVIRRPTRPPRALRRKQQYSPWC